MGNSTNSSQWAALERLRFIERRAFWCGTVSRQDLAEVFGLSPAQASADLQKYQEMNSGALVYNLRKKRYEGEKRMKPALHEPRLEEALAQFVPGAGEAAVALGLLRGGAREGEEASLVDRVVLPVRSAPLEVQRRLFLALREGWRVRVKYLSVHSASHEWRWLHPGALAHDGNRWHVRAWCETKTAWQDFNLSRMPEADWPVAGEAPPPPDEAWNRWVTLKLRPHHALKPEAQAAVAFDYNMVDGQLELRVREALVDYLRARLVLPLSDGSTAPPLLEVVES